MSEIEGYGKVHHINHRDAKDALAGPEVVIQEKIDGSQFSFGVQDGELHCRSKGKALDLDAPEAMFASAVKTARDLYERGLLAEGVRFRAEAVYKPRHNVLTYDRVPEGGMVVFDVDDRGPATGMVIALGLQPVAELFRGSPKGARAYLDEGEWADVESMLGGPKVEGVVIKSYDGGRLVGRAKIVGDAFREVRKSKGGKTKGGKAKDWDVLQSIAADYATPMRFAKARQYLAEMGELRGDNSDIGRIVRRVQDDLTEECREEIAERLWVVQGKAILGGVAREVAPWFLSQQTGEER